MGGEEKDGRTWELSGFKPKKLGRAPVVESPHVTAGEEPELPTNQNVAVPPVSASSRLVAGRTRVGHTGIAEALIGLSNGT